MPLRSEELTASGLAQFPLIIGGIVVATNIDGVGPGVLRLNGPLLADIFLGRIGVAHRLPRSSAMCRCRRRSPTRSGNTGRRRSRPGAEALIPDGFPDDDDS